MSDTSPPEHYTMNSICFLVLANSDTTRSTESPPQPSDIVMISAKGLAAIGNKN